MLKKLPLLINIYVLVLVAYFAITWAGSSFSKSDMASTLSEDTYKGEKIFKANCSGCHLNGQNLIRPNKLIIGSLKLKTKQSFKTFIESPPPPMPNFKDITSNPEKLDALYNYVVSLMGQ